jgi:pyroglutamyl-peptidase
MRPILLVTGFGPFPGVPFNVSAALVDYLASAAARIPAEVHTAILPTHWRDGPAIAASKIREVRPDAVVHFGVSRRACGFQFETRAYNQCARLTDCAGTSAPGFYLRRSGPPVLRATLAASRLMQRLRLAGLPAYNSSDAGRYLCNATLYSSLHKALSLPETNRPQVGFIHIPALPTTSQTPETGVFGWLELQRGAVEILHGLASTLRTRTHRTGRARPNRIKAGSI